jgi:hypothetical protein
MAATEPLDVAALVAAAEEIAEDDPRRVVARDDVRGYIVPEAHERLLRRLVADQDFLDGAQLGREQALGRVRACRDEQAEPWTSEGWDALSDATSGARAWLEYQLEGSNDVILEADGARFTEASFRRALLGLNARERALLETRASEVRSTDGEGWSEADRKALERARARLRKSLG